MHGGKSNGPHTPEGLARCRAARWKHGFYCKNAIGEKRRVGESLRQGAQMISELTRQSRS
jgi:hypothetical protein